MENILPWKTTKHFWRELKITLKSRDIALPTKVRLVKAMVFPVVMYGCELDYKESWVPKNWCLTVVLEKTLESPLDCKEIQPVNPKGNQSWIFTGRIYIEAETPILWPPDAKSWRIWKDPDAGKDWRQEEKGMSQDEMVGWHLWLNGHEFEWTPGVGDGQGGLACCSPWGPKESDTTEQLNWTELKDHINTKKEVPCSFISCFIIFHMIFRIKLSTSEKSLLEFWQFHWICRTRRGYWQSPWFKSFKPVVLEQLDIHMGKKWSWTAFSYYT